jgi:multiple sugar transport system ATP-binding protein
MAEISFRGVTKRFAGGTVAVRDLDLDVNDGEFMILVGPSGCGKTTALRMLAGLETVSEGEIRIGDEVVNERTPRERDIAMVFQSYALYTHMSVYKNLAFPLRRARMPKDEVAARVEKAARLLGIADLLDRKPGTLSGGQRQRVAMGRAIVRDPKAYLMDEPLSNLDAKLRIQMRAELTRIQRRLRTTTIFVTHDQVEAMTLGDRVAVMRDGAIQQVGAPTELYHEPRNLFVAGFIGAPAMNFVRGEIEAGEVRTPVIRIPLDAALRSRLEGFRGGREVIVGMRPEDFDDAKFVGEGRGGHSFDADVDVIEDTGSEVFAHLAVDRPQEGAILPALAGGDGQPGETGEAPDFVVRVNSATSLREGEPGRLWLDTAAVHLFDPRSGERIAVEDAKVAERSS